MVVGEGAVSEGVSVRNRIPRTVGGVWRCSWSLSTGSRLSDATLHRFCVEVTTATSRKNKLRNCYSGISYHVCFLLLLLLSLFYVLCLSMYCDHMCSIFDKCFQTKARLQRPFRGNKGKCHTIPSCCYCCDGYQDQGNYAHVI